MRKTKEELLEKFPYWNEERNDVVTTLYGDEPLCRYDQYKYKLYTDCYDSTLAAVLFGDAWIWSIHGDFDDYRLINGGMRVRADGKILWADLNVHYSGRTYELCLDQLYDKSKLSIIWIGQDTVKGWRNFATACPSRIEGKNKELSDEEIYHVLNSKDWRDFGYDVQRCRRRCVELYELDKTNHYLDEWRRDE